MSIFDLILKELLWIPIGLFVVFMAKKYQKFTNPNRPKQRGYYGGDQGYLSSFPDDNTDRQRQNGDQAS